MSRDYILHRVRTALGRSAGQAVPAPPEATLRLPEVGMEERIARFTKAFETLAGRMHRAPTSADAKSAVEGILAGRSAVASADPFLAQCGIPELSSVTPAPDDTAALRKLCATQGVGITSADYALARTGSLVMLSSRRNPRLVSLLPPAHIAVLPVDRLVTSLDELLSMLPNPAEQSSSMVLITGPSRTADIEQILVRGVHGPGEIHVVLVG